MRPDAAEALGAVVDARCCDSLADDWPDATVVCNPPFSLAVQFVRRCVDHAVERHRWCLVLVRVNWPFEGDRWGWVGARDLVSFGRVSFSGNGVDRTPYGWLCIPPGGWMGYPTIRPFSLPSPPTYPASWDSEHRRMGLRVQAMIAAEDAAKSAASVSA